jgi:hypothetical protein
LVQALFDLDSMVVAKLYLSLPLIQDISLDFFWLRYLQFCLFNSTTLLGCKAESLSFGMPMSFARE